jgi:hypothetical protein
MRITLDIPTERTAEVLRFLAALMPADEEPQADPAPGHPELPLAAIQAGKTQAVQEWCDANILPAIIAAADPLKVAMDDPVEDDDPTRRELPWGDLPEPPLPPEGKI